MIPSVKHFWIIAYVRHIQRSTQRTAMFRVPPIVIVGMLFFLFGFITWLNAALIPYLKIVCDLTHAESYLVAFAFYLSYFFWAIPSSWILQRIGFKKGMVAGLLVMAVGSLLFIPAAWTRQYGLFLTGLFVTGSGLTILQTAANPYVTILGPLESAARRISIMGVCNKFAGALSPLLLGSLLLHEADQIAEQVQHAEASKKIHLMNILASEIILPYLLIGFGLTALALLVYRSALPELHTDEQQQAGEPLPHRKSIFHYPHLMLAVVALFCYVGAEVIAGDTIIAYGKSMGIPLSTSKVFTTLTLLSMIVGYLIAIAVIPRYISQQNFLKFSAMLGVILTLIITQTNPWASVISVALLGLANAVVWPAIWPLALNGMGNYTKLAAALLIMAVAGGAILPLLYGWLADRFNTQQAYWLLIPCYVFIWYFASFGYKKGFPPPQPSRETY